MTPEENIYPTEKCEFYDPEMCEGECIEIVMADGPHYLCESCVDSLPHFLEPAEEE